MFRILSCSASPGLLFVGLLHVSLRRRCSVWQEENLQGRELPDNVVTFFVHNIEQHDLDIKNALSAMSCFGAAVDKSTLATIETSLNMTLMNAFEAAAAKQLVKNDDTFYTFAHDRIQEAAYGMIEDTEKPLYQKNSSWHLLRCPLETDNLAMLFVSWAKFVVCCRACRSFKYNLIAGKRSMELSDFSTAFRYFDEGMTYLPKHPWRDHYGLTLELFELATKCSQITGDATSFSILSDQIMTKSVCIEDKLNTVLICHYNISRLIILTIYFPGLLVLAQLEHEVPSTISSVENFQYSIRQILSILDGLADDNLLNYRSMTDHKTIMTMKFFDKPEMVIQQVQPELQPFITASPIGFAYFSVLISKMGDLNSGRRFVHLLKKLIQDNKFKEVAGEVIAMTTGVQCYLELMQSVVSSHLEGEAADKRFDPMCSKI
ncbi:hypothetical protein ACHAWO_001099 [Cyclotella atomus]|uniref:Uncharacterized protein n=1 Tax=Cyclotella atomus TaxID=382360 RepID=A0ABD3PNQ0_9STRA